MTEYAFTLAAPLIKQFEGCKLTAYRCPAGTWTIGWGHTNALATAPQVIPGRTITQAEADAALFADMAVVARQIGSLVSAVAVTDFELAGLISFVYNIGASAFSESTVLRLLKAKNYQGAGHAMLAWDKAHIDGKLVTVAGLVRRREAERAMFDGDDERANATAALDTGAMVQRVAFPAPRETLTQSGTAQAASMSIVGGLGVVGGTARAMIGNAQDTVAQVQSAQDTVHQVRAMALSSGLPTHFFLIFCGLLVVGLGALIIWRRYGRTLMEDVIDNSGAVMLNGAERVTGAAVDDLAEIRSGLGLVAMNVEEEIAKLFQPKRTTPIPATAIVAAAVAPKPPEPTNDVPPTVVDVRSLIRGAVHSGALRAGVKPVSDSGVS